MIVWSILIVMLRLIGLCATGQLSLLVNTNPVLEI